MKSLKCGCKTIYNNCKSRKKKKKEELLKFGIDTY